MTTLDLSADKTIARRFWRYVSNATPSECWEWTGTRSTTRKAKTGYGCIGVREPGVNGTMQHRGAHRVSWVLHYGEIPEGLCVLHRCDNPGCVNPEHLYLGTQRDNMADKVAKGRHRSQAAVEAWRQAKGRDMTPEQRERTNAALRERHSGAAHERACAVEIDGEIYPTQAAAAKALGLTRAAIHYRIKAGKARIVDQ